jgi:hypothetical protein
MRQLAAPGILERTEAAHSRATVALDDGTDAFGDFR